MLTWAFFCIVREVWKSRTEDFSLTGWRLLLSFHFEMLLAVRVKSLGLTKFCVQVKRFRRNSSISAKAYVLAMARIATALEFRSTAQEEIKCMLHLLDP